jgi:hypothetical protein
MSEKTWTEKAGGRKAAAFYACLVSIMVLALAGKAETHVLGLIDTLFLVFAGANVMIKPKQLEAKTAQSQSVQSTDPQPTDSMEKP